MPETEFLNSILNSCVNTDDEKEAFAIQNTLYAICILLNAAIQSEAIYAKGVIAIDDTAYECTGNAFPEDLIAYYGFWRGTEGFHLETARALFWPCVSIILDLDTASVEKLEQQIDTALESKPERNYYGAAINTADLQGVWLKKAQELFYCESVVTTAAGASASADDANSTPSVKSAAGTSAAASSAAGTSAAGTSATASKKHLRPLKHTRRTHGRRALTPPRTNRLTAFTRSNK
jgi:hypothetical protein